jgi:drug/metabolite transporter (DMT)-like permease
MATVTTLLWSGSYILNKFAFQDGVGPLTLSGLRYMIASLVLFCIGSRKRQAEREKLPLSMVVLLGVLGYAVAQGLQYVGQTFLTPTQSSLFLSVGNTLLVILMDKVWLRENQTKSDLIKFLFLLVGITMYYLPFGGTKISLPGLAFMLLSSVGYAVHMTLIRRMRRNNRIATKSLVAQPMLAGSVVLLTAGLITEGLPTFTVNLLLILGYLSLVSGALAFYLWTWSQKELTAFESSSVNNLMLIEIALMDFVVFHRTFSATQLIAVAVVFGAILSIQRNKVSV